MKPNKFLKLPNIGVDQTQLFEILDNMLSEEQKQSLISTFAKLELNYDDLANEILTNLINTVNFGVSNNKDIKFSVGFIKVVNTKEFSEKLLFGAIKDCIQNRYVHIIDYNLHVFSVHGHEGIEVIISTESYIKTCDIYDLENYSNRLFTKTDEFSGEEEDISELEN